MTTVAPQARIAAADPDKCIATWRNVLISVRRGIQTLDSINLTAVLARQLTQGYPAGIGLLIIYEETAELPDRKCRQATTQIIKEQYDHLAGVGVVFEGTSIRMTMLRTLVKTIATLIRPKDGLQVLTDTVPRAAREIAGSLAAASGEPWGELNLVRAITDLRAEYAERLARPRPLTGSLRHP